VTPRVPRHPLASPDSALAPLLRADAPARSGARAERQAAPAIDVTIVPGACVIGVPQFVLINKGASHTLSRSRGSRILR
jgi:hypothetical protein